MSWPHQAYNTLSGPTQPLLDFDDTFNAMTAGMAIPCNASGTNTISLLPLANMGALQAYVELAGAKFRAVANSTGPVTAQINGLGFLPVYKSDGVTQINVSDILLGQLYAIWYSAALNSGLGGFFLQSMPVSAGIGTAVTIPQGRLTAQISTPVNFTSNSGIGGFYYAPYWGAFCPIYNGSTLQMYQFTSSLSDTVGLALSMGGSANFPVGNVFDVFMILISGAPTLATVQWTNTTTRAT